MCDLCSILKEDKEYVSHMSDLYGKMNERLKATRQNPEAAKESVAFSTIPFPLIDFLVFEPRMGLQLPSNFYQNLIVDGKKLRNDWATGWIRLLGFKDTSLFLLTHAFKKNEGKELLLHSFMVEFGKGEWAVSGEGGKMIISAKDVEKKGIDLLTDLETKHTFSFSFIHQNTEHVIMPRDRIESSSLVKTIYHGHLPQKPLTFDYTEYVVTAPHFAPVPFLHQDWKKYGYKSAMDMQNAVTELLKQHLPK